MFSFNDDNLTKSTDVQIIICYNVDEMMQELFLDSSRRELIGSNNIMIQKCMERLLNYWNITQPHYKHTLQLLISSVPVYGDHWPGLEVQSVASQIAEYII